MYSVQDRNLEHTHHSTTASHDVLIAESIENGGLIYIPGVQQCSVPTPISVRKKKKASNGRKSCLLCILLLLTLSLIIALAVMSMSGSDTEKLPEHQSKSSEYCTSTECIISAANLLQSMNQSADPCDDFYNYACGNWKQIHPVMDSSIESNWISEGTRHILRKIRELLQEDPIENEPVPVTLARTFYNSCMDTGMRDYLGLEPVFLILEEVGLQRLPPLPSNKTTKHVPRQQFNWISIIAKIKRHLGIDVLLGFQITAMLRNQRDRIWLGEPLTASQQRSSLGTNMHKDHGSEDEVFLETLFDPETSELTKEEGLVFGILALKNMIETIAYIYDIESQDTKEAAIKMYLFQAQLAKLGDPKGKLEEKTVQELQSMASFRLLGVNFAEYFSIIFQDVQDPNFNFKKEKILVDLQYIKALGVLLFTTPNELLEFFLWWKVVSALAPHTNTFMESLEYDLNRKTTGVEVPEARSIDCTRIVKNSMDMAVSYLTATPEFMKTSEQKLQTMFSNIRSTFVDILGSSWLDYFTKRAAIRKANAAKLYVGYPEWVLNKQALENYYKDVDIQQTSYLNNVVTMMGWKITQSLKRLVIGHKEEGFTGNPLDVNALYNLHKNSITVIAGYLQFPFYGLGMKALEYGTMGYALGHELNHGFDDTGILYDENGEWKGTWSLIAYAGHARRMECFSQEFDNFEWDGQKVDGKLTLRENVADYGGIKTSLLAYQKLVQRGLSEPKLPGLEKFTHEQLFFLAYGNSRCTELTHSGRSLSLLLKHAPDYFRVLGTLINVDEFSSVWQCKKGSRMNPFRKKCSLW